MIKAIRILAVAIFVITHTAAHAEGLAIICGEVSTIVTEKSFCYVNNMATGERSVEVWIGTGVRLNLGVQAAVDIASATAKAMIGVHIRHVLQDGEDIKIAASAARQKAVVEYNAMAKAKGVAQLHVEGLQCKKPEPDFFEELLKTRSTPNQCTVIQLITR